jgi:kinesin family protein 2/24
MYDGAQKFSYANGGGFDDSDVSFASHKQISKSTVFAESNYLNAFSEKEKTAPVAKIKVVVCYFI